MGCERGICIGAARVVKGRTTDPNEISRTSRVAGALQLSVFEPYPTMGVADSDEGSSMGDDAGRDVDVLVLRQRAWGWCEMATRRR